MAYRRKEEVVMVAFPAAEDWGVPCEVAYSVPVRQFREGMSEGDCAAVSPLPPQLRLQIEECA